MPAPERHHSRRTQYLDLTSKHDKHKSLTLHEPAPVIEHFAPAPVVTDAEPATVIDYVAPAPTVSYTTPAPVIEHMPAPVI